MTRYRESDGRVAVRSTLLSAYYDFSFTGSNKAMWFLEGGEEKQTECMLLGRVAHCLLLENEKFQDRFSVYTGTRSGKDYKDILRFAPDLIPVPEKTYQTGMKMAETAELFLEDSAKTGRICSLLNEGDDVLIEKELSLDCGHFVKRIKPDIVAKNFFMDYKTTSMFGIDLTSWRQHIEKTNMHIQLGFYYSVLCGLKESGDKAMDGREIRGAYHLVQSTEPPYTPVLFFFREESLKNCAEDAQTAVQGVLDLESERIAGDIPTIHLDRYINFRSLEEDFDGFGTIG